MTRPAPAGGPTSCARAKGLEGVADRLGISASRLRQVNGLSPRARIGTGYTLIIPSENEGDRITLSSLLPSRPQPGAVGARLPPRLVQHTTVRGKHGRMVVERKVTVQDSSASRDRTEKADKGKPGKRAVEEREKPSAKGNAKAAAATKAGKPEKADKPVRQEKAEKPAKSVSKAPAPPAKAKAEPPKRR
jgi:hypothetical protein